MSIRRRSLAVGTLIGGDLEVQLSHVDGDSVKIGDGTNQVTLVDESGTKTIPVKVYGGGAGGTSMADDAAFTIGSTSVTPVGAVYKSSVDTVDDGDVGAVHMTSTRAMHVYIKGTDVGSSGGTSATDGGGFVASSTAFTPMGGQYDANESDVLADTKLGIVGLTAARHMKTYDAAVVALLTTQNGYLDGLETLMSTQAGYLDGIETLLGTTNTNTGNATTSLAIMDDWDRVVGAAIGTDGAMVMGSDGTLARFLKTDTSGELQVDVLTLPALAAGSNNIGDVDVLSVIASASTNKADIGLINGVVPLMGAGNTGTGSLRVTLATDQANLTTPLNNNQTQIGGVAISTGTGVMGTGVQRVAIASNNDPLDVKQSTASNLNAQVVGVAAHDAAVSGNPVRIAGRAMLANGTAVAEDDVADIATDNQGRVLNTPHVPRDLITHGTTTLTSTSETTILAAAGSGIFLDVTKIILSNSSATATRVQIRDATGGTVRLEISLAAGGGAVIDFGNVPMCATTANSAWYTTLSGAVTSVYCYMQAIKRIA